MNPLQNTIKHLIAQNISAERKAILQPLIVYIQKKRNQQQEVLLNFICTHNSRRSHLSQIWAQTMATYYGVKEVQCYSGGTEATAVYYKIIETIQQQGFEIIKLSEDNNPIYGLKTHRNNHPLLLFSKEYFHEFNPQSDYAAVVTCSTADENCPVVLGAEKRFAVRYDDPKAYDDTPQMNEKYLEKSIEIGAEMQYVFSQIN